MDISAIEEVAWVGKEYVEGDIKGVVLFFHGLGSGLKDRPTTEELEWARNGALVVYPYYGPWAWMNRGARTMVDDLVDAIYAAYELTEDIPLICTGASMGGQGSLLYTRYAKRKVSACLATSPVCDLHFHFRERSDLPPKIRCAFQGYPESLNALLSEHSPLHQVANMPDIPYRILHSENDPAVSKQNHSDKMVAAMHEQGLNVEYITPHGMKHCEPLPLNVLEENIAFVAKGMNNFDWPARFRLLSAGDKPERNDGAKTNPFVKLLNRAAP